MNNKRVSSSYGSFERVNKTKAKRLFENGYTIAVMTNDRNPVSSLTSEINFTKGKNIPILMGENITPETFDDVLEAFSIWLDADGYGHTPDSYRAKHHLFSYWIRVN